MFWIINIKLLFLRASVADSILVLPAEHLIWAVLLVVSGFAVRVNTPFPFEVIQVPSVTSQVVPKSLVTSIVFVVLSLYLIVATALTCTSPPA